MTNKNCVSFEANFPKNTLPKYPPGKEIATLLFNELKSSIEIREKPYNRENYSWQIDCKINNKSFFILIGLVNDASPREWLITIDPFLNIFSIIFNNSQSPQKELSKLIHSTLKNNNKIKNIRWYTSQDWNYHPETNYSDKP